METINTQEYNGWANYETWATKLWLDNDQITYSLMITLAKKARTEALADEVGDQLNELGRLAIDIEAFIDSETDDMKASLFSDLMRHALGRIDFREIASAYLEEI